jgi:hypothetical protein
MRHAAPFLRRGLRGQKRQPGVDLIGVSPDDFRVEPLRERKGERGFADSGRTSEVDWGFGIYDWGFGMWVNVEGCRLGLAANPKS